MTLMVNQLVGFGVRLAENLIRNPGFDSAAEWTVAGATISGGVCSTAGGGNFLSQSGVNLTSGVTYNVSLVYTTTASQSAGGKLRMGSSSGGTIYTTIAPGPSASGTFSSTFVAGNTTFVVQADTVVFHGTVDNIVVTEI
jgi:hypothetical protein